MNSNFRAIINAASINWEDPESVNMEWFGKDRNTLNDIVEILYPDCDIKRLTFLYQHYDFLENQIHQFIEADGMAYDKSNWILKQYFEHLVGGIPDQLPDEWYNPEYIIRKCDQPEFGSTDDWLEFVDAMYDMYRNGMTSKAEKAIKAMRNMHTEYINR